MCDVGGFIGQLADPLGVTRKGQAAPLAKELMDPAGFTEAILTGEQPQGYDPGGLSAGWKGMTGQTSREQAADQAAEMARQQALAREERNRAQEESRRKLALGSLGPGRGRASTILTGSSGLLGDGTSARRTLMAG